MNDTLLLLKNFIKKPKEIGAIMPSSRSLTKEITKKSPTSSKPVLVLPEKASQLEKPENICKDNNAMKISLNLLLNFLS